MVHKIWHPFRTILMIILLVVLVVITLFALSTVFPKLTYPAGYMMGAALLIGIIILTVVIVGDIFVYIFKIKKERQGEK